uniref:Uncharacterized protein n=1 Tax=Leptocylindrus danicus TaxID=163516 RepID=A0A7S2L4Q4_9STRA|mmetsp:Transcript_3086/g.4489  ORF Transcript_3086/g.4489 Transcript_3086/m.4489 type:complete len:143 (+) Transcript_3086:77-505(+)
MTSTNQNKTLKQGLDDLMCSICSSPIGVGYGLKDPSPNPIEGGRVCCHDCTKNVVCPMLIRQMIGGFVAFGEDEVCDNQKVLGSTEASTDDSNKCSICLKEIKGEGKSALPIHAGNKKCCEKCYSKVVEPTQVHRFFTTGNP